jgi:hypothetical protein
MKSFSPSARVISLAISLALILGAEIAVFFHQRDTELQKWQAKYADYSSAHVWEPKSLRNFVIYFLDWGLGDYPNYFVIFAFAAALNQRHRAFVHIALMTFALFVSLCLQSLFAQPVFFNMFPRVFMTPNQTYQVMSCKWQFALPSHHPVMNSALYVFMVIDYAFWVEKNKPK